MQVEKHLQIHLTTSGYSQLNDKPTHSVNAGSSCMDFIFTSNTNLVTDFGVNSTLHETCHQNLIFGKINFNNPLPSPFYRNIWDYKSVNVEFIQKVIIDFNCKRAFSNNFINENVWNSKKYIQLLHNQ